MATGISKRNNNTENNPKHLKTFDKPPQTPNTNSSIVTSTLNKTCEPWNYEKFLLRVSTYSNSKWFAKPPQISGLVCSRFGWECISLNKLKCITCKCILTSKLSITTPKDIKKKQIDNFIIKLQKSHRNQCGWKHNNCSILFEKLSMDKDILWNQINNNLKSWNNGIDINNKIIIKLSNNCKEKIFKCVYNQHKISDNELNLIKNDNNINHMILSVLGWKLQNINNIQIISCQYCNRCTTLKNYEYQIIKSINNENKNKNLKIETNKDKSMKIETRKINIKSNINTNDIEMKTTIIGCNLMTTNRDINCSLYETPLLKKIAFFNKNNEFDDGFNWGTKHSYLIDNESDTDTDGNGFIPFHTNNNINEPKKRKIKDISDDDMCMDNNNNNNKKTKMISINEINNTNINVNNINNNDINRKRKMDIDITQNDNRLFKKRRTQQSEILTTKNENIIKINKNKRNFINAFENEIKNELKENDIDNDINNNEFDEDDDLKKDNNNINNNDKNNEIKITQDMLCKNIKKKNEN